MFCTFKAFFFLNVGVLQLHCLSIGKSFKVSVYVNIIISKSTFRGTFGRLGMT